MLLNRLKENKYVNLINQIINSKSFMAFIVLLALLSNLLGIELYVYTIYALIVVITALFGRDFLHTLPIAVVSYMTFSKSNNPRGPDGSSIFFERNVIVYFVIICIIIGSFALARIIYDFKVHKERRKFPKLALGFIILGYSFVHGGSYSVDYEFKTSLFGFVEILAISFTYFIFYYTVDFKKVNKDYWAELFTLVAIMMIFEIGYILIENEAYDLSKVFNREVIWTGWGFYNNIGGIAIMCLPAPFYLAIKKNNGWVYCLIGHFLMLAIGVVMSRNAMMFGFIFYVILLFLVGIFSKGRNRINNLIVYIVNLTMVAIVFSFRFDLFENIFSSVLDSGTNDSGRIKIYIAAFEQFKTNPLFGVGFYECEAYQWGVYNEGSFLPARYHSTIMQLLASTGLVGFIAYLYHRFETLKVLVKNFNISKLFIFLSILVFLISSLFDSFFFNFGPGLIYSGLLLFLEKQDDLLESA